MNPDLPLHLQCHIRPRFQGPKLMLLDANFLYCWKTFSCLLRTNDEDLWPFPEKKPTCKSKSWKMFYDSSKIRDILWNLRKASSKWRCIRLNLELSSPNCKFNTCLIFRCACFVLIGVAIDFPNRGWIGGKIQMLLWKSWDPILV